MKASIQRAMPLLDEPAVRKAVALVAESQRVSPKALESILRAFGDFSFLGRDTAYWTWRLLQELRYEKKVV